MDLEGICTDPRSEEYRFRLAHPNGESELHPDEAAYFRERGFDVVYAKASFNGRGKLAEKQVDNFYVKLNPPGSQSDTKGEIEFHVGGTRYCPPNGSFATSSTEKLIGQIERVILQGTFNVPLESREGPIPVVICDPAWKPVVEALREKYEVNEYRLPREAQSRFTTRKIHLKGI